MRQYEIFELSLSGPEPPDSYAAADIAADFLHVQSGKRVRVKGFYAGNSTYKVRFLPQKEGKYQYEVTGAVREKGELSTGKKTGSALLISCMRMMGTGICSAAMRS